MRYMEAHIDALNFEGTPIGLARQLSCREGIADVSVDAAAGIATIRYDDSWVRPERVRWYIAESGYRCKPARADDSTG